MSGETSAGSAASPVGQIAGSHAQADGRRARGPNAHGTCGLGMGIRSPHP